jgi:hypothetical protein
LPHKNEALPSSSLKIVVMVAWIACIIFLTLHANLIGISEIGALEFPM